MELSTKLKPVPSNTTTTASSYTSPNPYARDSSRRAIACVTCAKAKTRCDKALPSCSRCITKGIKCDPRSTRRTTDNNYRTLSAKKPFISPKRFPTPGVLPSSNTFPSPRSIPSSRPRGVMRAPSHIDFRTAVKMSQQAAVMSGVPKLTPLPTYHSQSVDECCSYNASPEPDLCRFTPDIEQDGFPFSRDATPQTPADVFGFPEPLPVVEGLDYFACQPWSGDGLVRVGLGFSDLKMPVEDWMTATPEPEEMAQANMYAQNTDFTSSMQTYGTIELSSGVAEDWPSFQGAAHDNSESINHATIDSGIVMQGEWAQPLPGNTYVDMANMVTSAPYVPKMQAIPHNAPVWQDVFMPSAIPY